MPRRRESPVKNRQTGYYFFDEYVGFPPDKKRVRISLRTKDPEKAQWLWEKEYRRQWRQFYGEEAPEKPVKAKFQDIAEEFVDYERDIKKVREWKTIESRLRTASECWGDIYLDQVNSDRLAELDSYLKSLKHPRSPRTINHYMGTLKTMFYFAIRKKYYSGENPVTEVKPYHTDEKRREYSADEISRILEAAGQVEKEAWPNTMLQKYAKRIILLLLYTGMRSGEVLNLKWENIQADKIVLRRTETKQKREKVIPLTEGIKSVLESLKDERYKNGYIIPRRRDQRITSSNSTKTILNKMREISGIEDFDFHSLRHTASTIMVSQALGKGVGLADIMKILGHSKVETTMKYLHADFDRMKKAMEVLEEETRERKEEKK